jgi:hypothetical protein
MLNFDQQVPQSDGSVQGHNFAYFPIKPGFESFHAKLNYCEGLNVFEQSPQYIH